MKSHLAVTLSLATMFGAELPSQERTANDWPSTPVADQLRRDAKKMQVADSRDWKQYDAQVSELFAQHAAMRKLWQRHRPPPPPDLASLALPVAYLAHLWPELADRQSPRNEFVLADALAQCSDVAGTDLLLEHHDIETDQRYREDPRYRNRRRYETAIVNALAKFLIAERMPSVIEAQLARSPNVTERSLLFRLLRRFRDELPATLRTAGRDWLATQAQGPSNGGTESIWKLRFEFGDASDRDELIPHLLGEDLLYCLTVILHAPLPHPRLSAALRDRRNRMTEHERSYLSIHMRCALALTDPEREVPSLLERIRELRLRIISDQATRDEDTEYYRLINTLCGINHEQAHQTLQQFVQDARLPWSNRCWVLKTLILKPGTKARTAQAEQLRKWWLRTAPPGYRRQLKEALDYARNRDN